ncbi:MAG: transcriptional regulator [Candidatus Altiarchaeales archaeon]|nr:transcriptional regulator [Candidatus Altiarchaeales archaeon]MBD3416869.1 transcriptional regulator [Candidatus Altiarchaeales archaeon]
MANVKKRNGSTEPYDAEKVKASVKKAFIDAGETIEDRKDLIEKIAKEVTDDVKEKGEETTEAIKDKVVSSLDGAESKAGEAWRKFDKKYKSVKNEER